MLSRAAGLAMPVEARDGGLSLRGSAQDPIEMKNLPLVLECPQLKMELWTAEQKIAPNRITVKLFS